MDSEKKQISDEFDIHELQNKIIRKTDLDDSLAGNYHLETLTDHETINIVSILNLDLNETRKLLNPKSCERKAYVVLDRKNRSSQSDDRTLTTWIFQNNYNMQQGSTNALGFIRDITSIKIFDYYMRVSDSKYQSDQMIQTVLIPELQAQSFIAPETRKFHFWGKMWTNDSVVVAPTYLTSFTRGADVVGSLEYLYRLQDGNNGVFSFKTPIQTLNTLSLTFGSPYTLMPLNQDYFRFAYISGGVGSFVIETATDHNIPIGDSDRIYIDSFNTDNVADATLIQLLNRPPDDIVYVGQAITDTQLIITPPNNVVENITFPNLVGSQTSGNVYLDYFRFWINFEITYLSSTNDL